MIEQDISVTTKYSHDDSSYEYTEDKNPAFYMDGSLAAFLAVMFKGFDQINKEWDKTREEDPDRLTYADSFYLDALILSVDGCPIGTIRMMDDVPQFIQMKTVREDDPDEKVVE